ncbi:hypothetical protein PHET_01845 [Paragonimus heterotremus]|uniref:Uncharacterized protein n=1 Tax=Paragonimus heterotremus TaxID=100268 RepID=A0A8J4WK82_9TREM|nr:hypothetical protein PHET_01845 [Paragonimus heterotremus]
MYVCTVVIGQLRKTCFCRSPLARTPFCSYSVSFYCQLSISRSNFVRFVQVFHTLLMCSSLPIG